MATMEAIDWMRDQVMNQWTRAKGGSRYTNKDWTFKKLIRFKPKTMETLEAIAARLTTETGRSVYPYQVAAMLLEFTLDKAE